jgi:hypothetical protein
MIDLLLAPGTELAVVKCLKEYGKWLVRQATGKEERAAGTAIYYAAIAAAIVFHQERITELPSATLRESFAEMLKEPWIPQELKDLFHRARGACQQGMP